jgi:uncharacterized protein YdeI (YjbR/CyaY-like superfamily)
MDEVLHFKNRLEWRAWLSDNHKNSKGTWVYISKKNAKNSFLPYEEAVEEALCFGWIDGTIRKGDSEKFPQRFAPRTGKSIWSVSNKNRVQKLIAEGKMTEAGLAKIEEAKRNGNWDRTLGTPSKRVPEDFQKALDTNEQAKTFFQNLTQTNRYFYVYWIETAKKPTTRQQRITKTVTKLAEGKKLTQN